MSAGLLPRCAAPRLLADAQRFGESVASWKSSVTLVLRQCDWRRGCQGWWGCGSSPRLRRTRQLSDPSESVWLRRLRTCSVLLRSRICSLPPEVQNRGHLETRSCFYGECCRVGATTFPSGIIRSHGPQNARMVRVYHLISHTTSTCSRHHPAETERSRAGTPPFHVPRARRLSGAQPTTRGARRIRLLLDHRHTNRVASACHWYRGRLGEPAASPCVSISAASRCLPQRQEAWHSQIRILEATKPSSGVMWLRRRELVGVTGGVWCRWMILPDGIGALSDRPRLRFMV